MMLWFLVTDVERRDDGQGIALLAFVDRTRQHQLEVQMRELGALEAIRVLAAGSTHDLQSLLMSIQVLVRQCRAGEAVEEGLDHIEQITRQAATLTRHLLAFSRRRDIRTHRMDLSVKLPEAVRRLRAVTGARYTLRLTVPVHPCIVLADEMLIDQVVLNLVTNAVQAMPKGGNIDLVLRGDENPSAEPVSRDSPSRDSPLSRHAILQVTDAGHGMDETTLARATSPLYTTRVHEGGLGLGLAIVRRGGGGVDGTMQIESQPGAGTTVTLRIPLAGAAVRIADA